MSVIIEDMTMPECCMKCPMSAGYGCGYMRIAMTTKDMQSGRHPDCPLVEVEDDNRGHTMSVINREDTINYLMTNMNWHDEDGYPVEDAEEKRAIITDLINGVPDADDGWISCKDRLPKK